MLSACLHATDLGKVWKPAPDGWEAGRSTLQPYQHPALHAAMFVSEQRTAVIVRERLHGQPQPKGAFAVVRCSERALDQALAEARAWPLDFIEVLITRRDGASDLKFRCGCWGIAPIYLLSHNQVLHVNWDVTRLYPHLRSTQLNPGFAAQYLFRLSHPYSRQTIFPDVWRLTERAKAAWGPPFQSVKITYPRPENWARAMRLKPEARVVETFREILSASMQRWLTSEDDRLASQLSGGLDSSIVAATAAGLVPRSVQSYGLIMPDVFGKYQSARRDEVVRRFGLTDVTFPCIDYPPFTPKSRCVSGRVIVPWGEFYEEAFRPLLNRAASNGAHLLLTGRGGDELCSYQPGEIEMIIKDSLEEGGESADNLAGEENGAGGNDDTTPLFATAALREAYAEREALIADAPQALLYTSSLEAEAAISTLYLNHGIWPVSPLCTPELVEFCRRLPLAWRHQRIIERKVLTSLGCSPLVAYPQAEHLENFIGIMDFALREAASGVLTELFRSSRLAEQGFVNQQALMTTYEQYLQGDRRHLEHLLGATVLELTIRSIER